jgi:hypothetical protein
MRDKHTHRKTDKHAQISTIRQTDKTKKIKRQGEIQANMCIEIAIKIKNLKKESRKEGKNKKTKIKQC